MGLWSALTFQGKLAVVAVVLVGLTLMGYLYGDDGRGQTTGALDSPGFVVPTQAQTAASPTNIPGGIPVQQQTPAGQQTPGAETTQTPVNGASPTPQVTATGALPTPTESVAEPTATFAPPEPTVPPPPTAIPTEVPPTSTPEPTCVVTASVSPGGPGGRDTASGQLSCGGSPQNGASMSAVFLYDGSAVGCSSTSDGSGSASCGVNRPQDANLVSVDVCFSNNGTYCATARP